MSSHAVPPTEAPEAAIAELTSKRATIFDVMRNIGAAVIGFVFFAVVLVGEYTLFSYISELLDIVSPEASLPTAVIPTANHDVAVEDAAPAPSVVAPTGTGNVAETVLIENSHRTAKANAAGQPSTDPPSENR